ncbi:MAG TPA: MBL fold metallo-hydrolase, partial [Abditibacterium sp.]
MRITFLGHAAFLIETSQKRIITDPYSPEIGYRAIAERADFVTLSHHNPKWHSCLDDISGDFEPIWGLEILENGARRGEISFGAVEVFEKEPNQGPNAMIWLESEGLRVFHTGDCGILPSE